VRGMKDVVLFPARTVFFLALLLPAASCMPDGKYVDVNSPTGGSSGGGGSGPQACTGTPSTSPLATWSNLVDVVEGRDPTRLTGCFGSDCHVTGDREPWLTALNGNTLGDAALYTLLTTYVSKSEESDTCKGKVLVKPCHPEESSFYLSQAGMCGTLAIMPNGCRPEYDNCTPNDMLEGIRQWIAKGAPAP